MHVNYRQAVHASKLIMQVVCVFGNIHIQMLASFWHLGPRHDLLTVGIFTH